MPARSARVSRWWLASAAVLAVALAATTPAAAYIGPGAGFAAIGSLSVLLLAFLAALLSLLTWPFRMLFALVRGRKVYGKAKVKRAMWSRRAQEYEQKINSGDLISIAEVVRHTGRESPIFLL